MTRLLKVRQPTTFEVQRLCQQLHSLTNSHQARRAEALMLYGMGLTVTEIAAAQARHPNTIYKDLHAFAQVGLTAVKQLQQGGAPKRMTQAQMIELVRVAEQSPTDLGLPYGRWSLRKLSAYLVQHHIMKAIGREHLRQVLKKRSAFSARPAQAYQSRPATSGNFGPSALDFQAFAHRRPPVVLRCQADCGQSLWRAALHVRPAARVDPRPENARTLLSVCTL